MALFPTLYFLKENEQLLVEGLTSRRVINGPGSAIVPPFSRARLRKGITLAPTEYLRVRDTLTGEIRSEIGPKLFFPSANDESVEKLNAIVLKQNEYVRIIDNRTGTLRVERGEKTVYLEPTESTLGDGVQFGTNIDENSAVLLRNIDSGQYELITTPQAFIPSANQEIVEIRKRVLLKNNQYVRVIDERTGEMRVERGEKSIFFSPYETFIGDIQEGVNVDEHNAVLLRDTDSGQLSLITEPQVFIPASMQEIVEVRKRILLEDHHTVVIKDKDGKFRIRKGSDSERSFFLEPHTALVTFYWSSGLHKEKRELKLTHLDSRPKYMWYEFEVRTQDNVELVIGITFFWQIVNVEHMITTTDDTTGDICAHARSKIIQAVSRTTLEKFLAEFNNVVGGAVLEDGDLFYAERGANLLSVEVRHIQCKDEGTQQTLQEIIQETTNRLNRLQKQESENEIKIRQVQGDIEAEQQRGRLLEIQRENARLSSATTGESEAQKVRAFIDGLGENVSLPDKIALFNLLRKSEILEALSKGTAHLYFTPNDVDLSIDSHTTP